MTRTLDRLATSLGDVQGGSPIVFAPALDLEGGGVLWALPSLLAVGLLTPALEVFSLCEGFYPLSSLLLLLAFLALARIPTLEKIRYLAPAEWGKLLGLDRIPEVKTLRAKIKSLCVDGQLVAEWGAQLATEWMNGREEHAGVFYIDGHLREYSGHQAHLPRHFSSRQRLCLRGAMDYWVNAYGGDPFFVVSKELDPGMVSVLREEIVPRLLHDYHPPAEGAADDSRPKFTLIFDRGGFSLSFFAELAQQGIAILTYKKFVKDEWPSHEFVKQSVQLISGEQVDMQLAERPLELPSQVVAREIRRLTASGHQTAIICTDLSRPMTSVAPCMFARWCQENFFKYMMREFNIDHICAHELVDLPGTTQVVNPQWKTLASRINKDRQLLRREEAKLGALNLHDTELSPRAVEKYQLKAGELRQSIEERHLQLDTLKMELKGMARHVTLAELPEDQRYHGISPGKKMFVDIIKMIAYRAETTMASIVREQLARKDNVRALVQQLFKSNVDLMPDYARKTLTIVLHYPASHVHAVAFKRLAEELNATQTQYPGTELTMVYKVGS